MILDITNSFASNSIPGASTTQIKRIVSAYLKASAEQQKAPAHYQVSREWLPIYQGYMQQVITALQSEDIQSLKRMYENFFREKLSTGLHGLHFDMVEKYMSPNISITHADSRDYMNACQIAAKQFLLSNPNIPLDVLRRPPIGNPYGYTLDGTTIYVGAEYHYHHSSIIQKLLKKSGRNPVVFELGGGFGGMAYYLMRDAPDTTYIAADLPENSALQAYYLLSNFPAKKIALYGELDLDKFDPLDYDAIIVPNFAIDSLKENIVNLSFNSYSLAEMDMASIKNYIGKICNFTSEYFYHLNHAFWAVSADDFPVNSQKFDLLLRYPAMWGRDPHNCTLDHHEYIYERK